MPNRIVTRGMGTNQKLVTRGYGSLFQVIVEFAQRAVRTTRLRGRRAREDLRELYDQITVRATLTSVNKKPLAKEKVGTDISTITPGARISAYVKRIFVDDVKKVVDRIVIRVRNVFTRE